MFYDLENCDFCIMMYTIHTSLSIEHPRQSCLYLDLITIELLECPKGIIDLGEDRIGPGKFVVIYLDLAMAMNQKQTKDLALIAVS